MKFDDFLNISTKNDATCKIKMGHRSKKIDRTLPFKGQIDEVRKGLNDIKQLRDWIINIIVG